MPEVTSVHGRLGTMRKDVSWSVYPASYNESKSETAGDPTLFVQSSKRAVSINLRTKKGMLSNGKGRPGFHAATKFCGAIEIDVPQEFIDACLAAQPNKGDTIGGICVIA